MKKEDGKQSDIFEEWLDSNYKHNLHRLLDNFQLVNNAHFMYAVPSDTPSELYIKMKAAANSYFLRLKSVDYTLKKYGDIIQIPAENLSEKERILSEILGQVRDEISRVINWITSIDKEPRFLGTIAAGNAIIRLQSSYRTASLLIRLGYIFEAAAICRLILEQLAWAYSVHELDDETIYKTSPTKAISELKSILPEAGRTYGFLNKFTHIDPKLAHYYISSVEDDIAIDLNLTRENPDWAWLLLYLVDYYVVVTEYIFRNIIPNVTVIERNKDGVYTIKAYRPLREKIESYRTEIKKWRDCSEKPTS